MKITEDFIGNETKELTKTKIASILRWWGFNPDSYSTWGNARVDMNNILSGPSSSTISDRERASSFLSKINYINDTDTVISDTLFAANEPGVWYDPSDIKLDWRRNLLTKTEQFDDAAWVKAAVTLGSSTTAPDGSATAVLVVPSTAASQHLINSPSSSFPAGARITNSFFAKAGGYQYAQLAWANNAVTGNPRANFDVLNGVLGTVDVGVTATITSIGGGWFRCTATVTLASSGSATTGINIVSSASSSRAEAWSCDGTSGIYIWGADLRVANDGVNLPPYQRVNTATDYDTQGFPHYLRFDGVDDWLVTPTITPGTDKVQVFAGVRKLSDAASGLLLETGTNAVTVDGTLNILAPDASNSFRAISRGTAFTVAGTGTFAPAPISAILGVNASIGGDSLGLRVNGSQVAQFTANQGSGNYLAYPLYIGRRGGTTLPFNGRLYSLIVRFGSNLPIATIEKTEKYINGLTKAY